jgi:hypothetical protein
LAKNEWWIARKPVLRSLKKRKGMQNTKRDHSPTGRTTPHSYYEAFVFPNFGDYRERSADIRRGFNACVDASQLADIFFNFYKENDPLGIARWGSLSALRIDLCKREPCFNTIQSAATGV